jgi:hypothetical protein
MHEQPGRENLGRKYSIYQLHVNCQAIAVWLKHKSLGNTRGEDLVDKL